MNLTADQLMYPPSLLLDHPPRVVSLSGCCAACSSHRSCQAFSYDNGNGMCYMKNCDRPLLPGPSNTLKSITSGTKTKPASEARATR